VTSVLVEEALKKASLAWVGVGDEPARGLWCMPLEGTLIVVTGPGEQAAPGLAEAARASVRLRGDTGGLIVVWEAVVTRLAPGSEEWETVAPQLAGKRLRHGRAVGRQVGRDRLCRPAAHSGRRAAGGLPRSAGRLAGRPAA
jgi:hypothetical protein